MPAEHGGWAFLAEPVVLGLAVAPSWAGLLVGLAVAAGFLARQPLRLTLGDRRRGRRYPRTAAAERAFATLVLAGALALAGGVALARGPALVALGLAAPLAAVALALDLGQRAREAAAELAAALALASAAAAIPLAAGHPAPAAYGLWALVALRAAPSILYVRARLRLDRGELARVGAALAAQAAAVGLAALLARAGAAPATGVAVIALLAARAVHGLSPWRPRWSVRRLGANEAIAGAIAVLTIAIAAHRGW
jgi:hypothetical protein